MGTWSSRYINSYSSSKIPFQRKRGKWKSHSFKPSGAFPTWNSSRFWASSAQAANDYFIGLHIKWRVFPQLVRAIRVTDKMAEDPLMLKQKVDMMLQEQLWTVSWGTLFRSVHGCSGLQRWGTAPHVVMGTCTSAQLLLFRSTWTYGEKWLNLTAQSDCVQPHLRVVGAEAAA